MNKVAQLFLTAFLFAVLTMLTAIAWSAHTTKTSDNVVVYTTYK